MRPPRERPVRREPRWGRRTAAAGLTASALALTGCTPHHESPEAEIPTVDYTTDTAGTVEPNDDEYQQYRDVAPQYDPLGPVIPAPPDGSSIERWRAFGIAQCERWRKEPPWYRRGAGCHVPDDPITPHMVFDLPPSEKADLDREQQNRIGKLCDTANRFGYECNVIDTDGP
jgi:hypothetical protein